MRERKPSCQSTLRRITASVTRRDKAPAASNAVAEVRLGGIDFLGRSQVRQNQENCQAENCCHNEERELAARELRWAELHRRGAELVIVRRKGR